MAEEQQAVRPLRVGVVGAGWAGETHIKAYQQIPGVEVVALAEPSDTRRQSLGEQYHIPDLTSDYQPLVERTDLDLVSVCTPNQLHAPVSIAALDGGKHVLCEKPLARSAAEGESMVEAALRNGRVLRVAFNHRERGDVQTLKRYISSGGLGRIYHAKATWMRRSGIPGLGGWFTNRELAGGGPLIDLGVHVLDMALYLLEEPDVLSVSAATYSELGPRGRGGRPNQTLVGAGGYEVEDLATAFLRLANGTTLLIEASWAVYGKSGDDFGVTLYGTEGGAQIDVKNYASENTLQIFTDTAGVPSEIMPRVTRGEGHNAVVRQFVETVRSGNWANSHGGEGLRRTQIIDACYRSAQEGREISLVNPNPSA